MTLQDAIKSGKKFRHKNSQSKEYGTVSDTSEGLKFEVSIGDVVDSRRVSLLEVFSDEWELEKLPRTFYLGVTKIQSHLNVKEILQAVETPDGNPPNGPSGNNQPWIKVVEVLE